MTDVNYDYIALVTVLSFNIPLSFKHFSGAFDFGSRFIGMFGEVGLLTRNIVVEGGDWNGRFASREEQMFGCRIFIGFYSDTYTDCSFGECFTYVRSFSGEAKITGAEIRFCGQNGFKNNNAILFSDLGDAGSASFIRDSSIHSGCALCLE